MAWAQVRRPWAQQPQAPAAIDWSNPLARGLVAAYNASTNTLNGRRSINDTSGVGYGAAGLGRDQSGSTYTAFDPPVGFFTGITTALGMSVAVLFDLDNIATGVGQGHLISACLSNGAQDNPMDLRIGNTTTDTRVNFVRAVAGNTFYNIHATSSDKYSNGDKNQLLVLTVADNLVQTSPIVWAKGVKYSMSSIAGGFTGAAGYNATSKIRFGMRDDSLTSLDGRVYGAWVWGRALGDAEVAAFSRNPWQIFAPQTRRVFYSLGIAGVPTLSAATVTSITATGATPRVTLTF